MVTITESAAEVHMGAFEGLALPSLDYETSLSFESELTSPDGKGGVFVHTNFMIPGRLYPITVDGTQLVVVKQRGDVILYGLPE